MKNTRIIAGISIFMLSIFLGSCKKDQVSSEIENELMDSESAAALAEKSMSHDEDAPSFRGPNGNCNWQSLLPECAVVSESGEEFPKTITIDYGDGCTDENGINKSGMIIITLSAEMDTPGAVRTVSFQDYTVNESQIEGSRITTNTGNDSEGHLVFSRNVSLTITRNGHAFNRNSNETITWLSGFETEDCGDNVLQVEGSGTCSRDGGPSRTRTIVEPLLIDHACAYVTQGVIEISGPHGTGSINFGDGSCDNLAVVTRPNGNTQTIELHGH